MSFVPDSVASRSPASQIEPAAMPVRQGHWLLGRIIPLARLAAIAVCLQVLLVLCSPLLPIFEFANHTSMHCLITGVIVLPWLWLGRQRTMLVCTALALVYLCFLTEFWRLIPARDPGVAETGTREVLQVLAWNVLATNHSFAEIQQLLLQADPDVLVLIEVRPDLLENLPLITNTYPIVLERPAWEGSGIAVLSRVEGTELVLEDFEFSRQPAIIATIPSTDRQRTLQLVGLHTLSPVPVIRKEIRDRQLRSLVEWSQQQDGPVCVCGDLNITPWTRPFQSLLAAGFVDSRMGAGNCASWPARLGILGIPIDHALSKGQCQIFERSVLPAEPGSDHRPIQFKITF